MEDDSDQSFRAAGNGLGARQRGKRTGQTEARQLVAGEAHPGVDRLASLGVASRGGRSRRGGRSGRRRIGKLHVAQPEFIAPLVKGRGNGLAFGRSRKHAGFDLQRHRHGGHEARNVFMFDHERGLLGQEACDHAPHRIGLRRNGGGPAAALGSHIAGATGGEKRDDEQEGTGKHGEKIG